METTLNQTTTNTETDLIIPEVVDENEVQLVAFKKKAYIVPLQNIVHCIQFEAGQMNKHEAEAGYIKTRIGLALIAAKELVKPRTFGSWMEQNFAGRLSVRSGQICMRIAKEYINSEAASQLMLPPAEESGSWLVAKDEHSQFGSSIREFVAGRSISDLYEDCGVKPDKIKNGGYRPASWLLKNYVSENPRLQNIPFDIWPEEEKKKYSEWQDRQTAGDNVASKRLAAEQSFESIRLQLSNHCLTRKTHSLIDRDQAQIIYDVLIQSAADIKQVHKL